MSLDRELIEMLQGEMRTGFTMLAVAIGQTNAKLDQTNAKLDHTIGRLDQTNLKLDHAIGEFHEFRSEVNTKLNGISSLLISSERNVGRLEKRIVKLEDRMDHFEDRQRPTSS
ncbi:MAG: hypothetical protein WC028_12470 [Candidatus Obscuribacterales bacterium]|jgi:exonuclease VII small subunit